MAAVVVPWQDNGCPHRHAALSWVLDRWATTHPDWPVIVAEAPDGPWVKASAVTPAVAATDADVVVIHDADVWCDGTPDAVERVEAGHVWAIPHRRVHRLNEDSTAAVLAGAPPHRPRLVESAYVGIAGGGIVVLPRSTYLTIPLDPRFEGWGGEDVAWGEALHCLLGGPWRGPTSLWHLWHPPQPRMTRKAGSDRSEALRGRYHAARRSPDAMRALIEEATCPEDSASS